MDLEHDGPSLTNIINVVGRKEQSRIIQLSTSGIILKEEMIHVL